MAEMRRPAESAAVAEVAGAFLALAAPAVAARLVDLASIRHFALARMNARDVAFRRVELPRKYPHWRCAPMPQRQCMPAPKPRSTIPRVSMLISFIKSRSIQSV